MDNELFEIAQQLGQLLKLNDKKIATAESCTGGWIAQVITEVSGSSAWFDRGFVTYSNAAKMQMLGVKPETLDEFGAVSVETATEMVNGALAQSNADCAIAVTGIAGPDGGTAEKPVGTVFIAWAYKNKNVKVIQEKLTGNRHDIRRQTVKIALEGVEIG
ncbi:CinA family protein [Methylobacter sp. S3L5C]|uniref:CinA family protein n=1 Tax=Methylobacter sp. S3L5C TaxID=2839024 RepID=UPI001FADC32E|nr:CinA family protein [Methylobacter sp. S3L5C]UOA08824.1 CinA family protein [Methylobacter sp. S3L5C]